MGLPVVTLPSWQPASRQTETCLAAIGRREWVAADHDQYTAIATDLARDPNALDAARQTQRETLLRSAICDKSAFGIQLDKVLREMWRHYCHHVSRSLA
jgi:predicted O-linked N-acetylglucosamine transferase (SPINDLY family)